QESAMRKGILGSITTLLAGAGLVCAQPAPQSAAPPASGPAAPASAHAPETTRPRVGAPLMTWIQPRPPEPEPPPPPPPPAPKAHHSCITPTAAEEPPKPPVPTG